MKYEFLNHPLQDNILHVEGFKKNKLLQDIKSIFVRGSWLKE